MTILTDPFAKLNSSFFLVNNQKGKLFIGKELKITKEAKDKASTLKALEEVANFLILNILNTENVPPKELLSNFKKNITVFSQSDTPTDKDSIQVQAKVQEIKTILKKIKTQFSTKLEKILEIESSRLLKEEVDFLHRTASYLSFEYQVLCQVVKVLSISLQNEKTYLEALENGVGFILSSTDDDKLFHNMEPYIPMDTLLDCFPETGASFNEVVGKFVKFLSKRFNANSVEYSDLIKYLINYKEKGCGESVLSDMCLSVCKLREISSIEQKVFADYEGYLAALKHMHAKQIPLYAPSLEELHPHLFQTMNLIILNARASVEQEKKIAEERKKSIAQLPSEGNPQCEAIVKPVVFSFYKTEYERDVILLDRIKIILEDYQSSFDEKCETYNKIYQKLLEYRNGQKNRLEHASFLNYHPSLLENTEINFSSSGSTCLPDPQTFKNFQMILPKPVIFKEDAIVAQRQIATPSGLETTKEEIKKTPIRLQQRPKKKTGARRNSQHVKKNQRVQYFQLDTMPQNIIILLFSFLTMRDLLRLGMTNRSFYGHRGNFLIHLQNEEEDRLLAQQELNRSPALLQNEEEDRLLAQQELNRSPALEKTLEWIEYGHRLFEGDDIKIQAATIHDLQFGSILSTCAKTLTSLPHTAEVEKMLPELKREIGELALEVIKVMSEYYFLHSEEKEVVIPQEGAENTAQTKVRDQVLKILLDGDCRTIVTALDSVQEGRLLFAESTRMFSLNRNRIAHWKQMEKKCRHSVKGSSSLLTFAQLMTNKTIVNMLLNVAIPFKQSDIVRQTSHRHIADFNFIRGRFAHYLVRLNDDRSKTRDRVDLFTNLRNLFGEALQAKQWEKLFPLFESGNVTAENVTNIIFSEKCTPRQALMMTIAQLTCGEVKIALECCREAGKLSQEERLKLPQKLKERLQFSAVISEKRLPESVLNTHVTNRLQAKGKIGNHNIAYLNFCSKCTDVFPVFEALYWSILQSGVDISALEEMQENYRM